MRTPDDDRACARDLCSLPRSTAHADDGVALVLPAPDPAPGAGFCNPPTEAQSAAPRRAAPARREACSPNLAGAGRGPWAC
jgi:hypothetical protein